MNLFNPNIFNQNLFNPMQDIKVYAFVGPSGTGKSYRAQMVANEYNINYIIDDGILIRDNDIIAGSSAKKAPTKVETVKRAIFINEQENSAIIFPYNILEDSNKYKTLILNTCNEISCSPNFSYCDAQIIHIISEIQLSTLWQILPKQNDSFLKIDFSERSYIGLGKGYQQLVLCHKKLAKFVEERFSYEIIDTTYEEREKWEKGNVEFLNNIRTTV